MGPQAGSSIWGKQRTKTLIGAIPGQLLSPEFIWEKSLLSKFERIRWMVCDLGIKSFLKLLAAHTSLFIILFILLAEKQIIDTIMHSCIKHACHNWKWEDLASEAFFYFNSAT